MKTFRDFIFEKLGRMRIVMLGETGSGKSTYTEYLIKHFNITHIYWWYVKKRSRKRIRNR